MFHQLSLIWAVISLFLLIIAWQCAVRGNKTLHRKLMIFLTIAAWVFIFVYLLQYRYPGEVSPILPQYVPWIAVHGTLGLVLLFGASVLLWARLYEQRHQNSRLHLNRYHKMYGRVLVFLWALTHTGGIVNYWLFR